jgi:IS30 family transposase
MTKKQHYMTDDERAKLEAYYEMKLPVAEIARRLGFCRQTIYNELKLGRYSKTVRWWEEERYSAYKAKEIHKQRQAVKGRPLKIGHDHIFANYLERKIIHDRYSPAAALASARREGYTTVICVSTLYSYIDKGVFFDLGNKNLWEKSKRKPRSTNSVRRIAHPKLPSITERPQHINDREDFGHWEMDLIVSKAGSKPVLLTLTERISRQELIFKLPDRKSSTSVLCLTGLKGSYLISGNGSKASRRIMAANFLHTKTSGAPYTGAGDLRFIIAIAMRPGRKAATKTTTA